MLELDAGIRRVTFALPLGIDHVHCYLLPASGGGWTVVDTGLGLPDARELWERTLAELEAPVERIVITHFHPDHVGAAADLAALTGAPVHQGSDDYEQCVRTWGEPGNQEVMPEYLRVHGTPEEEVASFREDAAAFVQLVRFARNPERLEPGDRLIPWGPGDDVVRAHRKPGVVPDRFHFFRRDADQAVPYAARRLRSFRAARGDVDGRHVPRRVRLGRALDGCECQRGGGSLSS